MPKLKSKPVVIDRDRQEPAELGWSYIPAAGMWMTFAESREFFKHRTIAPLPPLKAKAVRIVAVFLQRVGGKPVVVDGHEGYYYGLPVLCQLVKLPLEYLNLDAINRGWKEFRRCQQR